MALAVFELVTEPNAPWPPQIKCRSGVCCCSGGALALSGVFCLSLVLLWLPEAGCWRHVEHVEDMLNTFVPCFATCLEGLGCFVCATLRFEGARIGSDATGWYCWHALPTHILLMFGHDDVSWLTLCVQGHGHYKQKSCIECKCQYQSKK